MSEASDKLMRARCRLMTREPWYGHMAMSIEWKSSDMGWVKDPKKRTMGMKINAQGVVQAFFNPEWVEATDLRIIFGVIEHSINHLIRLHTLRTGGREIEAWSLACVRPDEPILGKNNLMIGTIENGDAVYGQDGKLHKVTGTMRRKYSGEMLTIKGRYLLPIDITPEHPILVSAWRLKTINSRTPQKTTIKEYSKPIWLKAGSIRDQMAKMRRGREGFALVVPKLITRQITELDLQPYIRDSAYVRDHIVANRSLQITEDLAWLVGVYVAEGSKCSSECHAGESKSGATCQWTVGRHEASLIQKIQGILQSLGYAGASSDNSGNATKITCCSPIMTRALADWCGSGSHNKMVPDWVLHNSDRKIVAAFIKGYFDGDGHNATSGRPRNTSFSVSKTLALQIQLMGFTHGIPLGVSKLTRPERIIGGKTLPIEIGYQSAADGWRGCELFGGPAPKRKRDFHHDAGKVVFLPINRIDSSGYTGDVCNVETTDHSYLVCNAVVHNCDMAVNGQKSNPYIGYREEDNTLILPDKEMVFVPSQWPVNETAEKYYEMLVKEEEEGKKKGDKDKDGKGQGQGKGQKGKKKKDQGDGEGEGGGEGDGQGDQQGQGQGQGQGDQDADGEAQAGNGNGKYKFGDHEGNALDDHDSWNQSDISEDEARQIVHDMAKEAADKSQGHMPGHLKEILDALSKPIVRWREILRQFLGTHVGNRRKTYSRANRRNQNFGVKGVSHHAASTVNVIVDTSGSIGTKELEQFFAEIDSISSRARIFVLQWDHAFQGYSKYRKGAWKTYTINGRGGTDMVAPVDYLDKNSSDVDCMIMLTDGYVGTWPTKRQYPAVFVITTDQPGPDWGTVIHIKVGEANS